MRHWALCELKVAKEPSFTRIVPRRVPAAQLCELVVLSVRCCSITLAEVGSPSNSRYLKLISAGMPASVSAGIPVGELKVAKEPSFMLIVLDCVPQAALCELVVLSVRCCSIQLVEVGSPSNSCHSKLITVGMPVC
jgi:branched-subunit amino acid transport protein AzlD